MWRYRYSCQILIKLEFSQQICIKTNNMSARCNFAYRYKKKTLARFFFPPLGLRMKTAPLSESFLRCRISKNTEHPKSLIPREIYRWQILMGKTFNCCINIKIQKVSSSLIFVQNCTWHVVTDLSNNCTFD